MEIIIKMSKATYSEVEILKRDKKLEMPWDCEEDDYLYLFENNREIVGVIRLSKDSFDNDVIWIDEFEIIRNYRGQGIGKLIITEFLKEYNEVVKLLAKNKAVANFWYKCGFQYNNPSWAEIPMIYSKRNVT